MRVVSLIVGLSVAVWAGEAIARDPSAMLTGDGFLTACSKPDPEWIGFCHGYVQAVYDGLIVPGEDFCLPPGFTRAKSWDW